MRYRVQESTNDGYANCIVDTQSDGWPIVCETIAIESPGGDPLGDGGLAQRIADLLNQGERRE